MQVLPTKPEELKDEDVGLYYPNDNPTLKKDRILQIKDPKERERQCALWATVFGFNELVVQDFDDSPPPQLVEFRRLTQAQKEKHAEKVMALPEVDAYLTKRQKAEMLNKKNVEWLHAMIELMDEVKDHEPINKVKGRLNEFKTWYTSKYRHMNPYQHNAIEFKFGPPVHRQQNYYEPTDNEAVMKELNEES